MGNWLKYCNKILSIGLLSTIFLVTIDFQFVNFSFNGLTLAKLKSSEGNNAGKCPENIETLMTLMLKDLPNYANREIARRRSLSGIDREFKVNNYVILAGKPEFEPLPLNVTEYDPVFKDSTEQVFFTTLEREYFNNKAIQKQNYHWLFLTRSQTGWRVVTIFSQPGKPDRDEPPLPPEETSKSYIGRAIKVWLKDCRAGVIKGDLEENN